jgi:serine protease AprX
MAVSLATMAAFAVADQGNKGSGGNHNGLKSYVEDSLLAGVQANPKASFDVILQGDRGGKTSGFLNKVLSDTSGSADEHMSAANVRKQFNVIDGFEANLTGKAILHIAKQGLASSILANDGTQADGIQLQFSNPQLWAWSAGAPVDWLNGTPKAPTIAIVDSGIDPAHAADFGNRLLGQVNLASLAPNSPGDGNGHGTFVAGIAASAAPGYAGTAPTANLVSVDVMNDEGEATVSDVVAAADWIMKNKTAYNIKVANFSLHSANRASVFFDPIDQAVEKLMLNGVFVVAASGNYAVDGAESGVQFAPGNDPFVLTVGAADIMGTLGQNDDKAAPFSAWGYSPDGFMKPEISAPGRYMIGPVTAGGGLALERPSNVVSPGYMQLSGTSFSAPVVSGIAAMLIAQHPTWSTGQVKGALMLTSTPTSAAPGQLGVGEANVYKARVYSGTPPNANAALLPFVSTAADGTRLFNATSWHSAVLSSAAWSDAAWSDAAWSDAAWSDAAWSDAAWSDAAWASAAWSDAAWSDAAWSDAAWSDAAWSDAANDDSVANTDQLLTDPSAQDTIEASLGIVGPNAGSLLP